MFPYSHIHPDLVKDVLAAPLFDYYRLVNPRDHSVYDYNRDTGKVVCMPDVCYELWHRVAPCINCTSKTCRALQVEMIKVEYLDHRILLVVSVPVEVKGLPYALELIADVTESLMVADNVGQDNIAITKMIAEFNDLAIHDSFSTLYNKNYINNEIESLVFAQQLHPTREDASAPLVIEFDIDDFKRINDTYGHSVGDDVILYIAKHIKHDVEQIGGWVGRLGGDEFIICLPEAGDARGIETCRAAFAALEAYTFQAPEGEFGITISAGVTSVRSGDTRRDLLDRMDAAMYAAKGMPEGERWIEV